MDITTFTTHAWLSPHASANMQPMQNPRHFSSFLARRHSYTLIDPSVCVLLLPFPRSFFHAFTRFHPIGLTTENSEAQRSRSHPLNKIVVTLGSIGLAVCYSLFFLVFFLYNYGGD